MSGRHAEEGAGCEYVDPRDYTCDYCGHTIYQQLLIQVTRNDRIRWLCDTCYQRQQDEFERVAP